MPDILQQQAEHFLGMEIEPQAWDRAKENAERKLENIISREGDENGKRREAWYLAQLIAEQVRSECFTRFSVDFINLSHYVDKQKGIKKDAPYKEVRAAHYANPYCSTTIQKMQ